MPPRVLSNEITTHGLGHQQLSSFKNSPGEVGPENPSQPEQERFQLGRLGFLIGGRAQCAHNHRVVEEDGQQRETHFYLLKLVVWCEAHQIRIVHQLSGDKMSG